MDAAHGKFAAEDGVIAAVFVRGRAKAGRAKRETHAPVRRLAGECRCSARADRQHAQARADGSQRRRTRALHLTDRSARAAAHTSSAAKSSATNARCVRSALRLVSRSPPGMSQSCRPAEPMWLLRDRSRGPGRRLSLAPAAQASASGIPNFGSGRRSPVSAPVAHVVRSR